MEIGKKPLRDARYWWWSGKAVCRQCIEENPNAEWNTIVVSEDCTTIYSDETYTDFDFEHGLYCECGATIIEPTRNGGK